MKRTIVLLVAATFLLSGCSSTTGFKVKATDVEEQAERALFSQVGSTVDVTCEDDLLAQVGATVTCATSVDGLSYSTEMTVTFVSDSKDVKFDITVADEPSN